MEVEVTSTDIVLLLPATYLKALTEMLAERECASLDGLASLLLATAIKEKTGLERGNGFFKKCREFNPASRG